jgi:catechol 2,3-dioxygenase-like lactoylglutathione lyase family enzyme
MATTSINAVGTIFVPVADQEQALEFYVEMLGFEKRVDAIYGGGLRWIEVAPPEATNSISLVPPGEGSAARRQEAFCAFGTDDIAADHAALLAAGVDVDPEIAGAGSTRSGLVSTDTSVSDPVPAQFFFRDPDGNRFLIVQPA